MTEATIRYNAVKYPNFKEYLWYEANEKELLKQYQGRYIVIKNEQVIGDYESRKQARQETLKNHESGSFIIHLCSIGDPRRAPRISGRQIVVVDTKRT
ncbi:MAG: hypothetical protein IT269_14055 [Saprospiraceae bacterium]|nr:hypothetical protein [Saprospiraceae bacterium]